MEYPDYECFECGWVGWEPTLEEHDECWEIQKGLWVHTPASIHYLCPQCKSIFSIILKGE